MLAITDFNGTFVKEGDTVACIVAGEFVKGKVERVCRKTIFARYYFPSGGTYRSYFPSRRFMKLED